MSSSLPFYLDCAVCGQSMGYYLPAGSGLAVPQSEADVLIRVHNIRYKEQCPGSKQKPKKAASR